MTAHMIIALEHSSGCTEAMGLNPIEVPNFFFLRVNLQLLKLNYLCDDHIFIPGTQRLGVTAINI